MKNIALILIILIFTSCGVNKLLPKLPTNEPTKKEIRRSNRAAKKLERLVEKFPELKRTDTVLTKVSMNTPEITGTIIRPVFVPGEKEFITLPGEPIFLPSTVEPFAIPFNDNAIDALFSYDGSDFTLDYTIKPIPLDTIITTVEQKIQSKEYEPIPLSWWQITLMALGALLIFLFILTIIGLIKGLVKFS